MTTRLTIDRFPEHEARTGELAKTDAEFNKLCMDYEALSERIAKDETDNKESSDIDAAVRARRGEMENDPLRRIRAGLRV